jgi:hypothetical protein
MVLIPKGFVAADVLPGALREKLGVVMGGPQGALSVWAPPVVMEITKRD